MMCDLGEDSRTRWQRYLFEAGSLGFFMVVACTVTGLIESPGLVVRAYLGDPLTRRALTGVAMGLTAVAISYSRWGKQFGAHINPAFTIAMARLGRICPKQAVVYIGAQSFGAVAGVAISAALFPDLVGNSAVNYVVTVPGLFGSTGAFAAELIMTFILMLVVLKAERLPKLARVTGIVVGCLIAVFITVEGPISGMSLNPARTLGSAVVAGTYTGFWIYIAAPVLGMLAAAEVHLRRSTGMIRRLRGI